MPTGGRQTGQFFVSPPSILEIYREKAIFREFIIFGIVELKIMHQKD